MNQQQITYLLHTGKYKHKQVHWKLVETHISYVLLDKVFAFKIKKNIRYSFLNFTNLKNRKYFCERELALNNRLSRGVYLKVVPVCSFHDQLIIDGNKGKIVDYALQMKRLQEAKQMHLMLDNKQVTKTHIKALADLIRKFHENTGIIKNDFNPQHIALRFNDLVSVSTFIKKSLGADSLKIINIAVKVSGKFLKTHHDLFMQRAAGGFIRDCHGDLHARNIFLYHKPIVFDCIEFNDEFRQIDILDEIAFFCMDLEAAGFYSLSKAFTDHYFVNPKKAFGKKEQILFTYYKCYRANVRAKVNALRAMQAAGPMLKKNLEDVQKYLLLMKRYLDELL